MQRYNLIVKWMLAASVAALALSGCKKDINSDDAVRQGVLDYLNKRTGETGLNMSAMDVAVSNVTYTNNEATATVAFKLKSGGEGMSMNYVLERRGDKWVVKGRKESGGSPHSGEVTPPAPGGAMPPGHPPVEPAKPTDKK